MSLNFVILRHVGVISRQKRQLQKSYRVDSIGPPCSRTRMHSAKLVKIVKKLMLVKKFYFIILDSIYFLESYDQDGAVHLLRNMCILMGPLILRIQRMTMFLR